MDVEFDGVQLSIDLQVDIVSNSGNVKGIALWDTGASGSCISEKIAKKLNLIPIGKQKIFTPAGERIVNVYLIDIILPNKVTVKSVAVCDSDIELQGLDMLIGKEDRPYTHISNGSFVECTVKDILS